VPPSAESGRADLISPTNSPTWRPPRSGLAAEYPGDFDDAAAASQLSETSTSLVADPPLFSGGATDLATWLATRQSGQAFWSPTTVDTTGCMPAPLIAEVASLYF
jgi:hypothetical protein